MFSISKDVFVKTINEVKSVCRYQNGLNTYFEDNGCDGYLFQPDCTLAVINLLHIMFGQADTNEWIDYYCFELDFGEKYEVGFVKDDNGVDIDLSDEEHLYDFLVGNL